MHKMVRARGGGPSATFDRRKALGLFGTVSLGTLLAACADDEESAQTQTADLFADSPSCTLTAQLTEGPYYFEADSIRSDIREDREGTRLRLAVRVRDAGSCEALPNAVVDIWHCDALGLYSGYESASQGLGGSNGRTDDETYLRGAQVTNAEGSVEFTTVYPGWYRGRTVHVHAKVHLDRSTLVTTQLFFDDAITDRVYSREPYAGDAGRDTFNSNDSIFDESLLLKLSADGDGYLGAITLDVERA